MNSNNINATPMKMNIIPETPRVGAGNYTQAYGNTSVIQMSTVDPTVLQNNLTDVVTASIKAKSKRGSRSIRHDRNTSNGIPMDINAVSGDMFDSSMRSYAGNGKKKDRDSRRQSKRRSGSKDMNNKMMEALIQAEVRKAVQSLTANAGETDQYNQIPNSAERKNSKILPPLNFNNVNDKL